jgi:hypothetical protein
MIFLASIGGNLICKSKWLVKSDTPTWRPFPRGICAHTLAFQVDRHIERSQDDFGEDETKKRRLAADVMEPKRMMQKKFVR